MLLVFMPDINAQSEAGPVDSTKWPLKRLIEGAKSKIAYDRLELTMTEDDFIRRIKSNSNI